MIPRRLRLGAAAVLLCSATSSFALNTATIISSTLSPDCLECVSYTHLTLPTSDLV